MNQENFFERHISSMIQAVLWCITSLVPLFMWISLDMESQILLSWLVPMGAWAAVFYINYLWLIPKMLNHHKVRPFVWVNVLILFLASADIFYEFFDTTGGFPVAEFPRYILVLIITIITGIISLTFFVAVAFALRSVQRNRMLEKERLAQQEEISRMETEQLKAQLNPHFLFNSLNNISSLTAIDTELAQNAIASLSDMLRHILKEGSREMAPVKGELDLIEDYITLMRLRYTDRLSVNIDFPANPAGEIPPMLIIILMENAFKHGAANSVDSFINVKAEVGDGRFLFEVTNSLIPENTRTKVSHGLGLKNLRRRLDIQFPGDYTLTTGTEEDCYKAKLIIPCHD